MDWEDEQEEECVALFFMLMNQAAMLYRWILANNYRPRHPTINWDDQRKILYFRLFRDNDVYCHDQLRMRIGVFNQLCCRLQRYGLQSSRFVPIEEQVATFLIIVGHNHRNRCNLFQFFRSGQTISYYFHQVLNAIMRMYRDVVIPANGNQSPADANKDRAWEVHFKDAVGAIDGTHFFANVPADDRARYRDRKGNITQNVLVACTFDLKFTYVLAGWEGSAHDGRVLRCAVSRDGHKLQVPQGKYYLGDAGYALVPGFLTPYRGVIYHLHEREGPNPENARELYNYRHSSLRMVVERIIGVLKKRFAFLRSAPFHDIDTQGRIILACCALHNFLREVDPDDLLGIPEEVPLCGPDGLPLDVNAAQVPEPPAEPPMVLNMVPTVEWTNNRNTIAINMWGRRADNGWKPESLTRVSKEVNANIPREGRPSITNNHVRARLKTIRFQYLLAKKMLALSGFELDSETMMITGERHAWDSYIQAHPDASVLRNKPLTNYVDWALICGNENATGCMQNSGFESSTTPQPQIDSLDDIIFGDYINHVDPIGTPTQGFPNSTPRGEGPSHTTQAPPTPRGEGPSTTTQAPPIPNIGRGKKRTRARGIPDFVEINESFKSMVAAAQEMVANTKKTDYTKINQALKDLNISNRVLILSMKLFTGNKDLPNAFLAIDPGLRKPWLHLMIDGVIPEDIDHGGYDDREGGWM